LKNVLSTHSLAYKIAATKASQSCYRTGKKGYRPVTDFNHHFLEIRRFSCDKSFRAPQQIDKNKT
jgi:hypothetical protein